MLIIFLGLVIYLQGILHKFYTTYYVYIFFQEREEKISKAYVTIL